ncbi:MAG: DUF805 domain-containing protein [Bacilli bacterium]|nr:DUF805 domain-containing protein [Bacilli bacterium]
MVNATKDMFQKYAVFKGRTSRADFWWAILGYFILSCIVGIIAGLIMGTNTDPNTTNPIVTIWMLATFLPALGLEIRRLHDINKSGWWVLISLIPFVGSIILIVFYCLPAVNEGNNY